MQKNINTIINFNHHLVQTRQTLIMGILNVTQNSFYDGGKYMSEDAIFKRTKQILDEGGDIIDIGACSTKPGVESVCEQDELKLMDHVLHVIRKNFPKIIISVDTFRSSVAELAVKKYNASIINDISGGDLDEKMFNTVAKLQVPYVLMHTRGESKNMQALTSYNNITLDIILSLAEKVKTLHTLGVNDIIIDPGFGFAKTLDQNYELLGNINYFTNSFNLSILVGISRKSMIYNLLETNPQNALAGTLALNTFSLLSAAHFLRVHDVKETVDLKKIINKLTN